MKYLITGGTGFIGKNLTNLLMSKGETFLIIDKKSRGNPSVIIDNVTSPISAPEAEIFIHLAAETNVRISVQEPSKVFLDNCKGISNCLEFAESQGFSQFIYTSSVSSPSSLSPYLSSKFAGESLCLAYKNSYGIETNVLRLSNVYGPHSLHKDSVVHRFIKNCLEKESLTIFGNGKQTRDFIFVGDVVREIYQTSLIQKGPFLRNISSGILTQIITLARIISEISGHLTGFVPDIVYQSSNKGEIINPIKKEGIEHCTDLQYGLTKTFKWYMENYAIK